MIASAGAVVALLVGMQQLGVFNHLDTPAWESEVIRVQTQLWEQDFNINALRRQGIQNDLFNNQGQQAQFKLRRQPVPDFYLRQQLQLQNELDAVNKRMDEDQQHIRMKQ